MECHRKCSYFGLWIVVFLQLMSGWISWYYCTLYQIAAPIPGEFVLGLNENGKMDKVSSCKSGALYLVIRNRVVSHYHNIDRVGHHWFRLGLVAHGASCHCLNQWPDVIIRISELGPYWFRLGLVEWPSSGRCMDHFGPVVSWIVS